VGPICFATLPGEFTTVLGYRFRERLLSITGGDAVVLIGLANEYLSYFTTEQEHGVQHYEGASMVYGPAAADVVLLELERLAKSAEEPRTETAFYSYRPGSSESFGAHELSIAKMGRLQTSFYSLDNVLVREPSLAA
jgi:neutral ceramidase